jgi:hypothetical protein
MRAGPADWAHLGEKLHDANVGLAAHDPRWSDGTEMRDLSQ